MLHIKFMYTKKHEGKVTITWRCYKRSSMKCKGTLKTALDLTDPIEVGSHCHVDNSDIIELKESYQKLKVKAQTSLDKPNSVRFLTLTLSLFYEAHACRLFLQIQLGSASC